MAVFAEHEAWWTRIDFATIAGSGGIASVKLEHRDACRRWLDRHGYQVFTIDGERPLDDVHRDLSRWLRFEELYGHPFRGNLNALNDGFRDLEVPDTGGLVLEVFRLDRLWDQSEYLAEGLLQIAIDQTASCMAVGQRFFTVCVLPHASPLVLRTLTGYSIPRCWGDDWRGGDPFERPDGQ